MLKIADITPAGRGQRDTDCGESSAALLVHAPLGSLRRESMRRANDSQQTEQTLSSEKVMSPFRRSPGTGIPVAASEPMTRACLPSKRQCCERFFQKQIGTEAPGQNPRSSSDSMVGACINTLKLSDEDTEHDAIGINEDKQRTMKTNQRIFPLHRGSSFIGVVNKPLNSLTARPAKFPRYHPAPKKFLTTYHLI